MNEELAQLLSTYQTALSHGTIIFLRVGAVVALLPAFGEYSVPARVKLGIAISFTIIVALSVPMEKTVGTMSTFEGLLSFQALRLHLFVEPFVGFALGMGFRLFVIALQTAGVMIAQALSLSQVLGGAGADPMPAIGQLLVISGLAFSVISGLHIQAAQAMIMSYETLPPGQIFAAMDLTAWGVGRIVASFQLAFSLASPFLLVSLLYNVTLGIINRAMPQLMVAFVGAPAITFAALFLLMILASTILMFWANALADFARNPFEVIQ